MMLAMEVALLGGLGAVCRYLLDLLVSSKLGRSLPWGTMTVNVLGSGLAGVLIGATTYQSTSPTTSTLLLVGFLGGFTTASTIAYEVVVLMTRRRLAAGTAVAVGTMVAALAAGILGLLIGATMS